MKTLGQRIAYYRNLLGWSQAKLAKECGWSNNARIANYELDRREPSLADLALISKTLGISRGLLTEGFDDTMPDNSTTQLQKEYPLISWSQLSNHIFKNDGLISVDTDEATQSNSNKLFRLVVIGDSMTADSGLSIPENYIITVDQSLNPKHGQCVIAIKNDSQYAFRQYLEEAGVTYLKPFNKSYKVLELTDEWHIIGTVTKAEINLL